MRVYCIFLLSAVTNYQSRSGIKPHIIVISQFCGSEDWHRSHWAKIKVSAVLCSSQEVLGENPFLCLLPSSTFHKAQNYKHNAILCLFLIRIPFHLVSSNKVFLISSCNLVRTAFSASHFYTIVFMIFTYSLRRWRLSLSHHLLFFFFSWALMKIALTSTFLACTLKLLQPLPITQFHLDSFRYLHSNTLLFGTKICLSNLNNGHLCSHCSGGYMSIIKVQLNLISIERSLWLTDSLCLGRGGGRGQVRSSLSLPTLLRSLISS